MKKIPMLDNGLTPITGRLWFVASVCAFGHCLDWDLPDDDALFTYIADDLGMGGAPTVLFDPRTRVDQARYYPKGLNDPNDYEAMSLGETELPMERIFEIISSVHRKFLIAPAAQLSHAKLWAKPAAWRPNRNAEALVQTYVRMGLAMVLDAYIIRAEQDMVEGRLDLEIELQDPLTPTTIHRPAVLELKVLRSYTDQGATVPDSHTSGQIDSGLIQAASYRRSRAAEQTALCCFDMRREDTGNACFRPVAAKARRLKVSLGKWFLYASAARLRSAQIT